MKPNTALSIVALSLCLLAYAHPATAEKIILGNSYGDSRVRRFDEFTGAFIGDTVSLRDAFGNYTTNSDIDFDGNYYYSINGYGTIDGINADPRVRQFDLNGNFVGDAFQLREVDGTPVRQAQIGLATDGNFFYTIAANDTRVRRFSLSGVFLGDSFLLTEQDGTPVQQPQSGLATDGTFFYTVAAGDPRVRQFSATGVFMGDLLNLNAQPFPNLVNNTGVSVYKVPVPVTVPEANSALLLLSASVATGTALVCCRRRSLKNHSVPA